MWIKLISPRVSLRPMDSAFKRQMAPPLSLLILGAMTPDHHRVTISDENVERLDIEDKPDLVGITVKVDTIQRSREIARTYRQKGIPVVFGGIYPTTCPEALIDDADACVIGEAEELWGDLLQDVEQGCLKKIYKNKHTPDLSNAPIPRWELISGKNYLYTNTLTIGRGCCWQCDFCYNSSSNLPKGYRNKPINHIMNEIASLNTRHVMFIDDNFIANPQFARKLINQFLPLKLTWHTAVSADIGKYDDILDLMAESGCRSLFIGFETINSESLQKTGKKQNRVEEYERIISKIHDRGMMVNASIVFGFDEDTIEVFGDTTRWLIGQRIESMTAHILTPYPGTIFHAKLAAENRIIDHDLNHYNTSRAVFRPAKMTAKELEEGYLKAYEHFYSWRNIVNRIPSNPDMIAPYLLFNLFYRKFGKVVSSLGILGLMRFFGNLGVKLSYPYAKQANSVNLSPEILRSDSKSQQISSMDK